ncbi:unnamed protein product [Brachionus calyciflorus]|uniref:Uncharacterized protein n=1 Tax=Brachionus calyciflorus TaxID=104777 RepID=A0A813RSC5_9BILA|nr:unnamed protein product [Brachionus calyciflorus]
MLKVSNLFLVIFLTSINQYSILAETDEDSIIIEQEIQIEINSVNSLIEKILPENNANLYGKSIYSKELEQYESEKNEIIEQKNEKLEISNILKILFNANADDVDDDSEEEKISNHQNDFSQFTIKKLEKIEKLTTINLRITFYDNRIENNNFSAAIILRINFNLIIKE